MMKSSLTEAQIIGFLGHAEAGMPKSITVEPGLTL